MIDDEEYPRRYTNVIEAALSRPWAILPSKLAMFAEILVLRMGGQRFTEDEILERTGARPRRVGKSTGDVKVIPVYGSIIPRGSSFSDVSGGQATSMESFIQDINAAAADGNVRSILLDVDSPGGQVDMVPEAAAAIRQARIQKPVVAVANTMMASASYWLGSQASELVVTPSGEVGSIGVFALHNDMSKQMQMLGINPTMIKAGKYKAELSPIGPLSEEAKQYAQDQVDASYHMFTADVSKGRGVPVAEVRNGYGEGRMLMAKDAVAAGMADRVDTFANTLRRMQAGQVQTTKVAYAAAYENDGVETVMSYEINGSNGFEVGAATGGSSLIVYGGATPYVETDVIDGAWDGPAEEAKLPNPVGHGKAYHMYAWQDTSAGADPDIKGSYKFPHHFVSDAGYPGSASVNGVRAALSRLPQANIPEGDRAGVKSHLQKHLDKYNKQEGNEPAPDQEGPGDNEASVEETSFTPQDRLAELRQRSRTAAVSERESYLSLLRRINT